MMMMMVMMTGVYTLCRGEPKPYDLEYKQKVQRTLGHTFVVSIVFLLYIFILYLFV